MKISIVTPSFNQGHFIGETIESVITQKGDFEIEYIVMDGGSADDTVKILKQYEQKVKKGEFKGGSRGVRFLWTSKKDKGQSDAINKGLKRATGDILAYINSDDYYEPGCFQELTKNFKRAGNKKWLTGYSRIVDEKGRRIQKYTFWYKKLWLDRYSYNKILITNFICQPSTFWRKEIFKQYRYFNESLHYAMDYDFTLRIAKENPPVVVKKILANFRIHQQSKGGALFVKQFREDYTLACQNTKSGTIKALHKLHNGLIVGAYKVVK